MCGINVFVVIGALSVVAGLSWNEGVDVFALGCIIAELVMSDPLFPSLGGQIERLAAIERTLGSFPPEFAQKAALKNPHVFCGKTGRINFPNVQHSEQDHIYHPELVAIVSKMMPLSVSPFPSITYADVTDLNGYNRAECRTDGFRPSFKACSALTRCRVLR